MSLYSRKVIEFLRKKGTTDHGYQFDKVIGWTNEEWEMTHDFIQWLFPINETSMYNPDAPVLNQSSIKILSADPEIQKNLIVAFERFLSFCGLVLEEGKIQEYRSTSIFKYQNHNWLRITRVLKCLSLLGQKNLAIKFYNYLQTLKSVDEETQEFWEKACA